MDYKVNSSKGVDRTINASGLPKGLTKCSLILNNDSFETFLTLCHAPLAEVVLKV